jgi:hypothetical protein
MIRKILRFFDPTLIWLTCCAATGVALIARPDLLPHLLIR